MQPLFESACSQIIQRLSAESCVGAWGLADTYNATRLGDAARHKCLEVATSLVANASIGALSAPQMQALLAADELECYGEADVFCALEAWWRAQQQKPSAQVMATLVRLVRFSHIDKDFLRGHVRPAPCMQEIEVVQAMADVLIEGEAVARTCGATFRWGERNEHSARGWRPIVGERLKVVADNSRGYKHIGDGDHIASKAAVGLTATLIIDDMDGCPFGVLIDGEDGVKFSKPTAFDLTRREPLDEDKVRMALEEHVPMSMSASQIDERIASLRKDHFPSRRAPAA